MGRRKVEIKKIENLQARRVCFSKRRKGLFKKSREYSGLSSDDVLSIVFSSAGRPFILNTSSSSVESLIERYMRLKQSNSVPLSDDFSNGGEKDGGDEPSEDEEEDSEVMNLKDLQSLLNMDINALPADQLDEYLSTMEKLYETVRRARRLREMATSSNPESSKEEFRGEELTLVILQYLYENNWKESAHKLEQETGLFLNLVYIEELVNKGEWDEVEKYLSGFTKTGDNSLSDKLFFEIRKQKYFETLDKHDLFRASDFLIKNLKVFETSDVELFKELKRLLTFENMREHEKSSVHEKTQTLRPAIFTGIKNLIENNPLLSNKLHFPIKSNGRLGELIKQSFLNQHHLFCKNPTTNPEFKTVFVDHTCEKAYDSQDRSGSPVSDQPLGTQKGAAQTPHDGDSITNLSPLSPPTSSGVPVDVTPLSTAAPMPQGTHKNDKVVDDQSLESEPVRKKLKLSGISEEMGEDRSLADDASGPSDGLTENSMITEP